MRKLHPIPKSVRDEALDLVGRVYGIGETRAKCFYGPATPLSCWNATHYTDGRRSVIVLHGKFRSRARAGGYARAEVLAHELVHAFRVPYGESKFEEHLAWQTSAGVLRRALGGCFRSGPQILALVLLLPVSVPYELILRRRFNRARRALRRRGDRAPLKTLVRMMDREIRNLFCPNNQKTKERKMTMNKKLVKKHAVMMEYVIIAVLIAAAVVVAVMVFGRTVKSEFNVASTAMVNASSAQTQQKNLETAVKTQTGQATDHAKSMQKYDLKDKK